MFRQWLILTAAGGLCLLLAITMGRGPITRHLLGSDYWGGFSLMPLIALGYMFLTLSYSLNAYLYAHKNTSLVLMLGVAGAALSVVLVLSTAHIWGLVGVASACAMTHGLLMLMTGAVVFFRMRSPASAKVLTSHLL
jgi:O-antigen/teichoic acid export membrane protein